MILVFYQTHIFLFTLLAEVLMLLKSLKHYSDAFNSFMSIFPAMVIVDFINIMANTVYSGLSS